MRRSTPFVGLVSALSLPFLAAAVLWQRRPFPIDVPVHLDAFEIDRQLTARNDD